MGDLSTSQTAAIIFSLFGALCIVIAFLVVWSSIENASIPEGAVWLFGGGIALIGFGGFVLILAGIYRLFFPPVGHYGGKDWDRWEEHMIIGLCLLVLDGFFLGVALLAASV